MKYTIVVERGETSFGAYVSEFPGCIAVAETEVEVLELIHEAVKFHVEAVRNAEE